MIFDLTYMSGAGNLFTVIDNRIHKIDSDKFKILAPYFCGLNDTSKFKTEGLLVINTGNEGINLDVDFFNPDGSANAMCGNGARCALYYAKSKNIISVINNEKLNFRMIGKMYKGTFEDNQIKINFPPPVYFELSKKIKINDIELVVDFFNVGSKHAIINFAEIQKLNTDNFETFNINELAPLIRFHPDFMPAGVNVNIYQIMSNKILLRTYERGVEAETGACGTGAISTALATSMKNEISLPVSVVPTSQSELCVDAEVNNNNVISVSLKGPAVILDKTTMVIPDTLINNN